MSGITEEIQCKNLVSSVENAVARANYVHINRQMGIATSIVTYIPFAFGKPAGLQMANPYKQFFYDGTGKVIKSLDFADTGEIVQRETFSFSKIKGEEKIVSSNNISSDGVIEESYHYDNNGLLTKYELINPKWPVSKVEEYEYDKFSRKCKKTSYGLIAEPYLVTHYLYDSDKDHNFSYRYVTSPEGQLLLTILLTYDVKNEKQTGMYSFNMIPDEIKALRKNNKDWELQSTTRSSWQYNKEGNLAGFEKDVQIDRGLNMFLHFNDNNIIKQRLVTEKYMNEYEKLADGKQYLLRTTEWLPQFNEPLKGIKQYQYLNKVGKSLYSPEHKA